MKFIHSADLHIDSPLRGLDAYDGAPVTRLRGASRQALSALVDLAVDQHVAFVLFAGDIFDGNWADFRTGLFFREQLNRLRRANIRAFIVKGNHDAESQITRQLPDVEGVHIFSASKSETIDIQDLGVAIHGRSFPHRAVPEDLVPLYPPAVANRFNIGLLHTSLTGREGHDPYAPTTVEILCDKGYDYFALGHVHKREVVRESAPRIVFPGNLQGRHAKETGPKGCELVTVENGVITSADSVSLEVVRWHQVHVDTRDHQNIDELARQFAKQMRDITEEASDKLHAVRVHLNGESRLHAIEAQQPGTLAAAIHAATQDMDDVDIWIEEVRMNLSSPIDRTAAATREDAVGEVVRLVDAIGTDETSLRTWFLRELSDMKIPSTLIDADPAALDVNRMRAYLRDAEATVLSQITSITSDERPQ